MLCQLKEPLSKDKYLSDTFIIVKHAAKDVWPIYFEVDPQKGLPHSYSAHRTFSGQQAKISAMYVNIAKAQEDVDKLNMTNPSGHYAVCPVLNTVESPNSTLTIQGVSNES